MFILHTIANLLFHDIPCYAMLCLAMYYAMFNVQYSAIWRRKLKAPHGAEWRRLLETLLTTEDQLIADTMT